MSNGERNHLADIGKSLTYVIYGVLLYFIYQLGIKQGAKEFHEGKWICETVLETTICKEGKDSND